MRSLLSVVIFVLGASLCVGHNNEAEGSIEDIEDLASVFGMGERRRGDIYFRYSPRSQTLREGQKLTLECRLNGVRPRDIDRPRDVSKSDTIQWFKNGRRIYNERGKKFKLETSNGFGPGPSEKNQAAIGTLVIKDVQRNDRGNYKCQSRTRAGRAESQEGKIKVMNY